MDIKGSLGIDLGTSNSALAVRWADTDVVESIDLLQLAGPGAHEDKRGLPSALFFPNASELSDEVLQLPWEGPVSPVVGAFARDKGAQQPDRLVVSAKSWLCNPNVDPREALLPWRSKSVEDKVSPLTASTAYLSHMRQAFAHGLAEQGRGDTLDSLQVVVTVPASFDEAARRTTAEAIEAAGWGNDVILLEEPQAAFYSWLDSMGSDWRESVQPGEVILVCDVGGGTTDFSLIAVSEEEGELQLERVAVGDHILLGGDNIDMALAFVLRQQMEADGTPLDEWQFRSLIEGARVAKETLFEEADRASYPISVATRGSGLIAGTRTIELARETLIAVAVDGFFAKVAATDFPSEDASSGLQEFGLPYESDPVVSKHLAKFLQRCAETLQSRGEDLSADLESRIQSGILVPDAVLFNGGVFRAEPLRNRVIELVDSWVDGREVRALAGIDLDLAVARGACSYGYVKASGQGVRIRAGAARGYYIGVASSMMAIPGFKPPQKALCVVPQGMEEGSECVLDAEEFALVTGRDTNFRFFSSAERAGDAVGTVVADAEKALEETTKLELRMEEVEGLPAGTAVPVKLHSRLTELGALELWMQHTRSDQRWRLDFNVRTE